MVGPLGDGRVLVVGAGALGSLYGAAFARAGAEVQLLARRAHAEAIGSAGGLRVLHDSGAWFVPLDAVWRVGDVRPADVVVVMTKTPDTVAALEELHHLVPRVRVAVSWQNGMAKDGVLVDWCGRDQVVGGASMVGALGVEPGIVRLTLLGQTFAGELPRGTSERVAALVSLLEAGGFPAVADEDVLSVEWSKLVQVLPAMSMAALTRLRYHETMLVPDLASVFVRLIVETAAVARAAGATVMEWPDMLPVATLSMLPESDAQEELRCFGRSLVMEGRVDIKPSMLQSLERRRRLEVDAIQGHVVREAERLGVPAPTVALCHQLLAGIDRSIA